MKFDRVRPPPVIKVEMTEDEAEALCALIGGVDRLTGNAALWALYEGLDDRLPNRTTSFSDLFDGDVRVK